MGRPQENDLTICESPSSTWHYHLRVIGPEGFKPSGGDIKSLCGLRMGWDVPFPMEAWGKRDHIPSQWCSVCADHARELHFSVPS